MEQPSFKDHFSQQSQDYALFRPHYPDALGKILAELSPSTKLALDVGCGTGQFSEVLTNYFDQVIAIDGSAEQITQAKPHPKIQYRQAFAENIPLADNTVDLISVAQAAHWLDLDNFYTEVRRVAKPNAILALITYGVFSVDEEHLNHYFQYFYEVTIAPYWPPERHHVDEGYKTLSFPFQEIVIQPPVLQVEWNFYQVIGYMSTWSAVKAATKALGHNPLNVLADALLPEWEDPELPRVITWPLSVRVGRVNPD
ncbi:SAM-dependent methyltransferase [Acinetobacter sp. LoGeW2-3]|uniref:class I SAM-dependent methyltransferase n=1 Tax=Acinetobacter sp. LoGeW2-3 TaxID=1808001 RepID=UPI000C05BD37|nr:class I SAM-dependent methyltransferase [Acinetobacter sp. LoGeW2-3]ATO18548.1 SAM-dependent methyltransferase [Acinetobacter sp. LoGeW2-3]